MNERLRPCPFCGGEAAVKTDRRWPDGCGDSPVEAHEAVCQNMDCIIYGADSVYYLTEAEAIAAWNMRAADKPETFHDEFYDCESKIDKAVPQGADGNLDQAQVEWLRCMPDGWDGTPPVVPVDRDETHVELVSDIRRWSGVNTFRHDGFQPLRQHRFVKVMEFINRQAAITERECTKKWQHIAEDRDRAEMERDDLKAERDEWKAKAEQASESYLDAKSDRDKWKAKAAEEAANAEGHWKNANNIAEECAARARALDMQLENIHNLEHERDDLRRQVSELRELNDSLHARIESAMEVLS